MYESEDQLKTHLCQLCRADEPISLLVKNTESFPDLVLHVRVLELSGEKKNSELQMIKTLFEYLVPWPCHQPDKLMKVDVTISILVKERRNDKVLEMFYIDQMAISSLLPDRSHWPCPSAPPLRATIQSWSSPGWPKLIKNPIAPKRLFWCGSSSWHERQIQKNDIIWERKEKKRKNTKHKYFAWNSKTVSWQKKKTLYEI